MTERSELAEATAQRLFGVGLGTPPAGADQPGAAVRQVFAEHAYADSWTRTALDDRSRSLITIAMLAALSLQRELRPHLHGALTLGVTPEQIADVCVHVGVYAGVPRGSEAWSIAEEVISSRTTRWG
ncbi:MAG: carboxymuconolactone decarboxylase family protein [Candidatus Nanopelagicales bacterium]|nr:carboxymuconolactone decarboxylase family protein [Candidatus Nanopelagicales bacterium]